MTPKWKDLKFIKQVVVKPEDESRRMYVDFYEENAYDAWDEFNSTLMTSRDRRIMLGANSMYEVHMDYPEDFKKLVAATGDVIEAYRIYQVLKQPAPKNWHDYIEENVW